MAKNTICVWYAKDADAAARFYAKTFPDSAVDAVQRAPSNFAAGKKSEATMRGLLSRSISTGVAAAFAFGLVFALAGAADARPKKSSFNCTMDQVQAPSSAACLAQLDKDIIAGVAYPHTLVCDASGVSCCQSDGTRTFNCQKTTAGIRSLPLTPLNPGTTIQIAPP